jgi:hypothetical protein
MALNDEIAIPHSVLVRCPVRRFAQRRALHCEGCEHFRGLTQLVSGADKAFAQAYAVRCAYPVDRELAPLAED